MRGILRELLCSNDELDVLLTLELVDPAWPRSLVAAAAPPLRSFLVAGAPAPTTLESLEKLRPFFCGKSFSLDLEGTGDSGYLVHNLSP